jgi:hypothetical protein
MTPAVDAKMPPILRGMFLLARGHAVGLNCFRDTPRAFLISLAPGFGILTGIVTDRLMNGAAADAVREIPGTLCMLLAPSVLSYELARLWGRDAFWHRYIVAFNWCQWLLSFIGFALISAIVGAPLGEAQRQAVSQVLLICLAGYALWLNWFIARYGLALTVSRAIGLVLAVNLGTIVILLGPTLLAAGFK